MTDPLLESRLHSLPLLARGKVRDNYAVGAASPSKNKPGKSRAWQGALRAT